MGGLRLMVYDRTCTRHGRVPVGLSHAWWAGAPLYRGLGRLDAWRGVASWEEALDWLAHARDGSMVQEVQFWGHGRWGRALVGEQPLDAAALVPGHAFRGALERVRERIAPGALWWFRTCETLGARPGHDFAQRLGDLMGCAVAGHTYIIGPLQSGLHRLDPGQRPHWSEWEGLRQGTPDAPEVAWWSHLSAPNTIHCLQSRVPPGW